MPGREGSGLREQDDLWAGDGREDGALRVQLLHTAERLLHGDRSAVIRPISQDVTAVPDKTSRARDQLSAIR